MSHFFTSGRCDIEGTQENVLAVIDGFRIASSEIGDKKLVQPRWTEPRRIECELPEDPLSGNRMNQWKAVIMFMCVDLTHPAVATDLTMPSNILTSGTGSTKYKALVESCFA
jgi:hypothetical protein